MTAFLLSVTAIVAYFFGSISTVNLSSNLIFHCDIKNEYPLDNLGITRFVKDFGVKGLAKFLGLAAAKALIPLILGGVLLGIVDHADIGQAFAMFCMVLGIVFPIMYRFKGSTTILAVGLGTFFIGSGVGFATLVVFLAVYFATRYVSLAKLAATLMMCLATFMMIDTPFVKYLVLLTALVVFIENRHAIVRLVKGKEKKFRYRKDISYMFDK